MLEDIKVVRAFSHRVFHNHCWYCGIGIVKRRLRKGLKTATGNMYWNTYTRDHMVARAFGGGRTRNLIPACLRCNTQKADLFLDEFRIVFFGIHSGAFWGERLADALRERPAYMKLALPPEIPLNHTTACIERYEASRAATTPLPHGKSVESNKEYFQRLWLQENSE